jgi:hypothetical protein
MDPSTLPGHGEAHGGETSTCRVAKRKGRDQVASVGKVNVNGHLSGVICIYIYIVSKMLNSKISKYIVILVYGYIYIE